MIRAFLMSSVRPASSCACTQIRYSSSALIAEKADSTWKKMKWNKSLDDKARSLIFGEKKYSDFTLQEQRIVNFYQQKKLQEDAVILPNTYAALEQAEVEKMLLKRYEASLE